MAQPADAPVPGSPQDPLTEALGLAQAAATAGLGMKLLGGLAVRVLCPDYPPRLRADQDMDFATTGKGRKNVAAWLADNGCEPDRRFNNLNGDQQMYFTAPSGRPVDVMVDRLVMCHALDLRPSLKNSSLTLDPADLLLSKLQIVELNGKDVHDITHLLSGVGIDGEGGSMAPSISTARLGEVLSADWGWWRTCTGSLEKLPALVKDGPAVVPEGARYNPLEQAARLLEFAHAVPKGAKWKMRARLGDRVKWYELPEEVAH